MDKQLADTMKIIEDFFWMKCKNSDLVIENTGDKGWYYMHERTAKQLKRELIKYKMRNG